MVGVNFSAKEKAFRKNVYKKFLPSKFCGLPSANFARLLGQKVKSSKRSLNDLQVFFQKAEKNKPENLSWHIAQKGWGKFHKILSQNRAERLDKKREIVV